MEDLTFQCPQCKQGLQAPVEMAGTDFACPACNHPIHIPDPLAQPSAAGASAAPAPPQPALSQPRQSNAVSPALAAAPTQAPPAPPAARGISSVQGWVLIVLLLLALGFPLYNAVKPLPRWEYYRMVFLCQVLNGRQGSAAVAYSSIALDQKKLAAMGNEGWEIAGMYLEMETAFPNFGKEDLVTGIRENVRPQCLVVIFKRQVR